MTQHPPTHTHARTHPFLTDDDFNHNTQHGWMPFAYLLTYLLFSIVYWLSGGTDPEGDHYIYPPLNYDRPSEVGAWRISTIWYMDTWMNG